MCLGTLSSGTDYSEVSTQKITQYLCTCLLFNQKSKLFGITKGLNREDSPKMISEKSKNKKKFDQTKLLCPISLLNFFTASVLKFEKTSWTYRILMQGTGRCQEGTCYTVSFVSNCICSVQYVLIIFWGRQKNSVGVKTLGFLNTLLSAVLKITYLTLVLMGWGGG